jgi:nicotinate-nucleotide pyrophosphorylase (carboxylating)
VTAQARGIVSGLAVARALARRGGLAARAVRRDGAPVRAGTPVLVVEGEARRVLALERSLLNVLMHLSGVATATRAAVEAVRRAGGRLEVRGTRKTLPGLRDLETRAIVDGGGRPHRHDLASGLLLKNNHLALVPMALALRRLAALRRPRPTIEVEVRSSREAADALAGGAEELLLDNLGPRRAARLVAAIRAMPGGRRIPIELSGGITPANVGRYARSGAQSASLGALTHSAAALPFHMSVRRRPASQRR